jgi:hypothetical protein|tara:strand:+ start:488 stop:1978 length:1491 start_codon:yes stop_codon:yes gene_type:complete
MSYRQPQIIQDKSGMIIPQALAQASGAVAKGIQTFGVEEKKRKAEEKKKAEQDNRQLIAIGNAHAKDSAIFNAGLKDMSESMRNTLITRNERSLNRIDEIKRAQIINGNSSPALSKELGGLQQNILEGNSLAKTMIATSGNLDTLLKEYEKMGKTMFYRNGEDGTNERSRAIVLGFGGAPGYDAAMIEEGGKLYAQVTDKQSKKVFKIEASKFQSIADDLIVNAADIEGQMSTINSQGTFNKDGSLATSLTVAAGKESALSSRMDGNKTKVFYRDTTLNQLAVAAVKNKSFENALATIESSADDSQLEQITLGKIGISGDKYETYKNLESREEKNAMIKESSNEFFDKQLSQKGIINEDGNYIYRKDIQKETVSQENSSSNDSSKMFNTYTKGLDQAMKDGVDKNTALADIFQIGGNKRIRIGGSYYTPRNVEIEGDIVTVTKTGKPDQEKKGAPDLDKISYDLSEPKSLYNFLRATTTLKESDITRIRKQILSYK